MKTVNIPFGKNHIVFKSTDEESFDLIYPWEDNPTAHQENELIQNALANCLGSDEEILLGNSDLSIAVAINDLTRPVPYHLLIPQLLTKFDKAGINPENITFFIATGTHTGLKQNEIDELLTLTISNKYRTIVHNCDTEDQLTYLGESSIGTPIYINSEYYRHDIKIVVGHIEPHHFMGFSGGVKSAVIGLGGRKLIEANHRLIVDENAKMGKFYSNPMRKDIEEIGKVVGVDFAFNVLLNSNKKIINAYYGDPYTVMEVGIKDSILACQVENKPIYDLVIASPGGYPKDINFYQAQKAITHGCMFLKKNGVLILVAECIEGVGNFLLEDYMQDKKSFQEVIKTFENESFRIGPHKAYQIALQLKDHSIFLISRIQDEMVESLLLVPVQSIENAIDFAQSMGQIPMNPKIAVLPYATHVIPRISDDEIS